MDKWVTTRQASKINTIGLSQHRIAELARQGEVVASKTGKKKWLVKVDYQDGKYELVKSSDEQNTKYGLQVEENKRLARDRHWGDLAILAAGLASNLSKIRGCEESDFAGNVVDGGSVGPYKTPGVVRISRPVRDNPQQLEKVNGYLAECLLEHLKEHSDIFASIKDWREVTGDHMIDVLIDKLLYVANGGILEGTTCKICKSGGVSNET